MLSLDSRGDLTGFFSYATFAALAKHTKEKIMSEHIMIENADKILLSICEGKEQLLALGQQFNQAAALRKGEGAFISRAYRELGGTTSGPVMSLLDGAEAIFDARDRFMLSQVDRLPWTKEERARFFQAYYADDTRQYEVKL